MCLRVGRMRRVLNADVGASVHHKIVRRLRARMAKPRDKAGQNGKMSPNVPLRRSADCRDRTGQKPKGFVPDVPLRDRPVPFTSACPKIWGAGRKIGRKAFCYISLRSARAFDGLCISLLPAFWPLANASKVP